jgi:hypothetical protein
VAASTLLRAATASTRNCEPRNHDADTSVSTYRESRGRRRRRAAAVGAR